MVKKLLLFFILLFSFVIQITAQIRGVVKDADTGEPISFLNVFYEGKAVGAITDLDGRFEIQRVIEWKELTFSSIGYVTKVVPISAKTQDLVVMMKVLDHTLDEVVVKPKKGKYSRKNNPAVEMMKKVRVVRILVQIKGMVIWKNCWKRLAPSRPADSYREPGTADMEAMYMTM